MPSSRPSPYLRAVYTVIVSRRRAWTQGSGRGRHRHRDIPPDRKGNPREFYSRDCSSTALCLWRSARENFLFEEAKPGEKDRRGEKDKQEKRGAEKKVKKKKGEEKQENEAKNRSGEVEREEIL